MSILRFIKSRQGPIGAANLILKKLKVNIPKSILAQDLEYHPDYPSMLSISDVFRSYGVDNVVVRASIDAVRDFDGPCIVPIKLGYNHAEPLAELEFGEIFTGVALFVEKGDSAGEADFDRKVVAERKQILKK